MSRKDDDDFLYWLALYWLMKEEDEEEGKKDCADGCLPTLLFLVFVFGGVSDNPYWKFASLAIFCYFMWNNFRRFSKWLLRCLICYIFQAFFTPVIEVIIKLFVTSYSTHVFLKQIAAISVFIFAFFVICPWISRKAEELVHKKG